MLRSLERPFAEVTVALPKVADDVEVVPSYTFVTFLEVPEILLYVFVNTPGSYPVIIPSPEPLTELPLE